MNLHEHRCDTLKFRGCFLMTYGHHKRIYRQSHCVVISFVLTPPPLYPKFLFIPFVTVMMLLYLLMTAHISSNSFHITYCTDYLTIITDNQLLLSLMIFASSCIESPVVLRLFVYKYYIKNRALHNTNTNFPVFQFWLC